MVNSSEDDTLARVTFTVNYFHDNRDPIIETLWAKKIQKNIYKLDSSPFYAYGVSYSDTIRTIMDSEGRLLFSSVVKSGGHSTFRIFIKDQKCRDDILNRVSATGATYEGASDTLIAIDCPPEVGHKKVKEILIDAEQKKQLEFEEAKIC